MVSLLCNIGSHLHPGTNRTLKSCRTMSHNVARCRMMSHDAHVNTCYNVNCQRRTREHDAAHHRRKPAMGSSSSAPPSRPLGTSLGTNRAPKKLSHDVVQCRAKSRDAQGNMCYNVDCQRRTREHTLPGATRTQKVVTECHQKSRDRRVNTCYNANW